MHNYIRRQRKESHRGKETYLPLEYDASQDAQMDWGEAAVKLAGKTVIVQFFSLRLDHSKARFVMAFPFQKQEAFFEGHIQAFHFFGGVPRRITYDNLKTAVYKILEGKKRQEQQAFKAFRSYYLFETRYCTPTKAHEKGGVENDIGYAQRNFFSPIPEVVSYQELNAFLRQACLQDMRRRTRGQTKLVAELWEEEKANLLPLPSRYYAACITRVVKPNGYLQVAYETNRYSVPYEYRDRQLVLRAFPFRIELLYLDEIAAVHQRCFEREQDILDPLHYLPLLSQRPGAFEHAKPLRQWRQTWLESYDRLLQKLRGARPEGQGVREFLEVLRLHQDYPKEEVEQAVKMALELGAAHLDGVRLCLRQLNEPEPQTWSLDMNFNPELEKIGVQPLDLGQYDRLVQVR